MARNSARKPRFASGMEGSNEPIPLRKDRKKRGSRTETSSFGSSRRESHDASSFYSRFVPPELSTDETVAAPTLADEILERDARDMAPVASNSVALVVTSPPYFAGKEYEISLGRNGVPGTYLEYLDLLEDVFAECKRVLEPGGRIAVNVANLGRKPYRSLASDVIELLEGLGFLLRGEIVWRKAKAASGSCAWGTFMHPANPVLRDVTERIVVASKGRFDRALSPEERKKRKLPHEATVTKEEFLEATLDLWEIPAESATRVGHPAPFPVELPMRLIELYTYKGDLVLDPFVGSGTTAVAAIRTGRRYLGFDTDESYVRLARRRVAAEAVAYRDGRGHASRDIPASRESTAIEVAAEMLRRAGFQEIALRRKLLPAGVEVALTAKDAETRTWAFDVAGSFTTTGGLDTKEVLWRVIAVGSVMQSVFGKEMPYVVLTTDRWDLDRSSRRILEAVRGPGKPIRDVVALVDEEAIARLAQLALGRI